MRIVLTFALSAGIALAAIGDNAPSIPPTYVQTHPRLSWPTNTELQSICVAGGVTAAGDPCAMVSRYRTAANAYVDSTTPQGVTNTQYLHIAYMASKCPTTACA